MTVDRDWTPPPTYELAAADGRVIRYCLYGPEDGAPAIFHSGSPSTRWKHPDLVAAIEHSNMRMLVVDRPGYGGSTRQCGRAVADVAGDATLLADAHRWAKFAVFGGSGGGPHALACAALLPDRVTRCAVVSGIMPPDVSDLDRPGLGKASRLAVLGESALRPYLESSAAEIMARIHAGGPEFPPDPYAPETDPRPGPALEDPAAMARLRATFVDSHDGWVDDNIAFVRPWGFDMEAVSASVGIWHGTRARNTPDMHAQWLLSHIAQAEDHGYHGGHLPDPGTFRRVFAWMAADAAA